MSIIVIFIIWYLIFGQNSPKIYSFLKDKLGKIILFLVLISVFSGLIPGILWISVVLLIIAACCLPFYFIIKLIASLFKSDTSQKNDFSAVQMESRYVKSKSKDETKLTKSAAKRTKAVRSFSKKYDLNLTESEITRIVDASYMSWQWKNELADMFEKYDSVYEWLKGSTSWLRVFMRAYPVNSISSDFNLQKDICLDTFEKTFKEVDVSKFRTIEEYINEINNKFFTNFDDVSFMIAYRFLEVNGRKCELPNNSVIKNESEIDYLMHEYDKIKDKDFKEKYKVKY